MPAGLLVRSYQIDEEKKIKYPNAKNMKVRLWDKVTK